MLYLCIYEFPSIIWTNVYKTSTNTASSFEMTDMTCNCTFMTIAENINVKVEAKIEALVTEKFKYITGRVDALGVDITNIVRVVDGLAAFVDANAPTLDALLRQAESSVDDEPVAPEPVAPVPAPVDNLAQILDEMRLQQREMRDYIGLWAVFVMLFIAMLYMVHAPAPAASPACCPECPVVNDWVVAKCFADEFVKNARDEWVRITKK